MSAIQVGVTGDGIINFTASATLTINATVTASGGNGEIYLVAGDDVNQNADVRADPGQSQKNREERQATAEGPVIRNAQ